MAIRINTEDNEIIVSDVATEETLLELLKAVEKMDGGKTGSKQDPAVKKTQEALKNLASSNKDLNITMKDWSGNFDDTMEDLDKTMSARGKMIAGSLGKIVKNTGNVISDLIRGPASFESLGRAIQAGANGVGDMVSGLTGMASAIPYAGGAIAGAGKAAGVLASAAGAAAMAIAAYSQNMFDGFVALSQTGANYNADIVRTAGQIQRLGLNMNAFTQIVQQNAAGLANFGGSVSLGAKRFVELTDTMHGQFGGQLYALGITYDEQAEQMAKFTQTQSRNTAFQNMSYSQQSVLFKDYITDLTKLTGLTGKSRQQLSEEISQNNLRADADLRLAGATVEAQKALQMAFSASGGQDSAISQLLMAGIAGKDLAMEMAGGNTTIKNFVAGNAEAANKIRDLGDAVATGKISQDEFHKGMRALMPQVEKTGKEFSGLYGLNGIATTMTEAGASVQKYNVQMEQLQKAEADGQDGVTKSAAGAGGAIMKLAAEITNAITSIKSGVNTGIADFVESMGWTPGKELGSDIQNSIGRWEKIGVEIAESLGAISKEFQYFGEDPLDYVMGGASEGLKRTVALKSFSDDGTEQGGREKLKTEALALAKANGINLSKNQSQAMLHNVANASFSELEAMIKDGGQSLLKKVLSQVSGDSGGVALDDGKGTGTYTEKDIKVDADGDALDGVEQAVTTTTLPVTMDQPGGPGGTGTSYPGAATELESNEGLAYKGATIGQYEGVNSDDVGKTVKSQAVATQMAELMNSALSVNIGDHKHQSAQQYLNIAKAMKFTVYGPDGKPVTDSKDHGGAGMAQYMEAVMGQWMEARDTGNTTGMKYYSDMLKHEAKLMQSHIDYYNKAAPNGLSGPMGTQRMLLNEMLGNWPSEFSEMGVNQFKKYGGNISAGLPYIVGEKGPEMVIPKQDGRVLPNDQLASKDGSTNLLTVLEQIKVLMSELNTNQIKSNEISSSLNSEQLVKLSALISNSRTQNKIATFMASNS